MPQSVWRRVLLAAVLAAGLIVVLQIFAQEAIGGEADPDLSEPPPATARVPDHLRHRAVLIYLVSDPERMPQQVAPVAEVLEDGRIAIQRPAPLPESPEDGPWLAAGVVMPRPSLVDLTPEQRVALLDLCNGFSGGDRLHADQVIGLGFAFAEAEMRRLLNWIR